MAHDSSAVLGATELAGSKVNKRGFAASLGATAYSGNVIADQITRGLFSRKAKGQKAQAAVSSAPDFGRLGYLAVTADELVLIKMESSAVRTHLGEVLARVPRDQVASADFESSAMYASGLTITFSNGETWLLEAPRPSRKDAHAVITTLQG
jgi:hypothetical protein